MSYFDELNLKENILNNTKLRDPQKFAYFKAMEYYEKNTKNEDREIVIVLPTGTGKTGLIALLPYGIAKKRVLIIAPQLTIKNGILKNLSMGPENFYSKFGIIEDIGHFPRVIEYRKNLPFEIYEKSDIVVVNIHKLQERITQSLISTVDSNFFDLIIIDEAHHSVAETWRNAIEYFKNAKVIKITGTPFRADGEAIKGTEVYTYPLSSAMVNCYVKSLKNLTYIPQELFLTLDGKKDKLYTIDEIRELKLKDDDWIARSVAYSTECSEQVVMKSIELLKKKKENSKIPHKIIAVACSVEHAKEIKELYEKYGVKATLIHSKLDAKEQEDNFKDIDNNRVDAVINVAMLGEGYDHKYLSIAAIFRPFRNLGSYMQFIGRILRYITESDNVEDNIGEIIAHKGLNLEKLWEYYREEIEKSNISKEVSKTYNSLINPYRSISREKNIKVNGTGKAFETGIGYISEDTYINTQILKDAEEKNSMDREKIKILSQTLNISEKEAQIMLEAKKRSDEIKKYGFNRPDLIYLQKKQTFDQKIKEEIVPNLLYKKNYKVNEKTIANSKIFEYNEGKYKWIISRYEKNDAILVLFINSYLKDKVGRRREDWDYKDFENAEKYLDELVEYLYKYL